MSPLAEGLIRWCRGACVIGNATAFCWVWVEFANTLRTCGCYFQCVLKYIADVKLPLVTLQFWHLLFSSAVSVFTFSNTGGALGREGDAEGHTGLNYALEAQLASILGLQEFRPHLHVPDIQPFVATSLLHLKSIVAETGGFAKRRTIISFSQSSDCKFCLWQSCLCDNIYYPVFFSNPTGMHQCRAGLQVFQAQNTGLLHLCSSQQMPELLWQWDSCSLHGTVFRGFFMFSLVLLYKLAKRPVSHKWGLQYLWRMLLWLSE